MDEKSLQQTIQILKIMLPEVDGMLVDIRKGFGFLNFPDFAIQFLSQYHSVHWAHYYENRTHLKGLMLGALFGPSGLKEFIAEAKAATAEENKAFVNEFKQGIVDRGHIDILPSDFESMTEEQLLEMWNAMSDEERHEAGVWRTLWVCFMMTTIGYYLAIMTFGRSMCELVTAAKNGDDDAFCQAVQIDRTVLFAIPYFRERLIRAQVGSEPAFLNKLANAMKGKVLGEKLSYPKLMLAFAMLDDEGFLDISLDKLLNICEDLGLYGREFGVEDTESLRKRRAYYRKMTGRQIRF